MRRATLHDAGLAVAVLAAGLAVGFSIAGNPEGALTEAVVSVLGLWVWLLAMPKRKAEYARCPKCDGDLRSFQGQMKMRDGWPVVLNLRCSCGWAAKMEGHATPGLEG